MKFTRNALLSKEVLDDVLSTIGGTCVTDNPIVDVLVDGVEALKNDVRFALHDHA
jgi:hypothetical protein